MFCKIISDKEMTAILSGSFIDEGPLGALNRGEPYFEDFNNEVILSGISMAMINQAGSHFLLDLQRDMLNPLLARLKINPKLAAGLHDTELYFLFRHFVAVTINILKLVPFSNRLEMLAELKAAFASKQGLKELYAWLRQKNNYCRVASGLPAAENAFPLFLEKYPPDFE